MSKNQWQNKSLKQYFNATFREVRYLGHWKSRLQKLPQDLIDADEKPDLVIVVRAEKQHLLIVRLLGMFTVSKQVVLLGLIVVFPVLY